MLDNSYEIMKKEIDEQKILQEKIEKKCSSYTEFDGIILKCSKKKGKYYFYAKSKGGQFKYLGPESHFKVKRICESRYYKEILRSLKCNIKAMEHFLSIYRSMNSNQLLERIPKQYHLPGTNSETNAATNAEWNIEMMQKETNSAYARYIEMKKYKETIPVLYPQSLRVSTFDGTMVRSKTESVLYERFCAAGFYVIYEYPIEYEKGKFIRPDFLLIHKKTGQIILWEHLGMWFHPDTYVNYRKDYLMKTDTFRNLGFVQGVNFFASFESEFGPDMERIAQDIELLYKHPSTGQMRKLEEKQQACFQDAILLKAA